MKIINIFGINRQKAISIYLYICQSTYVKMLIYEYMNIKCEYM